MKMDKIAFATLVGFISDRFCIEPSHDAVQALDDMIDIEVPAAVPVKASLSEVNDLLKAVKQDEKISAIKAYRTLTGAGLKESKDALEAHAFFPPREATLGDILPKKTAATFQRELINSLALAQRRDEGDSHMLRHFTYTELQKFRDFVNSFDI